MKLNDQTCSLELSKKLHELGVKKESLFYWIENFRGIQLCGKDNLSIELNINKNLSNKSYSAFTASELLELLPSFVGCWLDIVKGRNMMDEKDKYSARYYMSDIVMDAEENICNTLAKMLIHLIENKIIEV